MYAEIVIAILGTSSVSWVVQYFITRYFHKKDSKEDRDELIIETLAAVTYALMSMDTERLIAQGYATGDDRRSIGILHAAYKKNGWNGDMDSRMERIHSMPFKKEAEK